MQLLPDVDKIPARLVKFVWRLLQPVQRGRVHTPFNSERYARGTYAKTFANQDLERLDHDLEIKEALLTLQRKKLIILDHEEDSTTIVLGYWRPVLIEHDGLLLLYHEVYRQQDVSRLRTLVPILLVPTSDGGIIFVDKVLVNVNMPNDDSAQNLNRKLVSVFMESSTVSRIPARLLEKEGTAGSVLVYYRSGSPVSFPGSSPHIYEVYMGRKLGKLIGTQSPREARGHKSHPFGLQQLTETSQLSFPIEAAKFPEKSKPTNPTKKNLTTFDPEPKRTKVLFSSMTLVLGMKGLRLVGKLRVGLVKLRLRLDSAWGETVPDWLLYRDYFELIKRFGLGKNFIPPLHWWYSDGGWATFCQVVEQQYPGGGYQGSGTNMVAVEKDDLIDVI